MNSLEKRFPRYSKLLKFYPQHYRDEYGNQILQTLADMLDDASSRAERMRIWSRVALDFPATVAAQNVQYFGGIMAHETPKFVWRNGLIGAAMLLPFAAAIIANGIDELAFGHALYNTWVWRMPTLAIWVLWLPLAAAILGLASLLIFLPKQRKAKKETSLRALIDIRYNWPLIAVALGGSLILAFVFFHDSVHCVAGNPVRELHNPSATLNCIQQG